MALNLSDLESFRVRKFSFRVLTFRTLKLSNLESFRALKLSILATGFTSRHWGSERRIFPGQTPIWVSGNFVLLTILSGL